MEQKPLAVSQYTITDEMYVIIEIHESSSGRFFFKYWEIHMVIGGWYHSEEKMENSFTSINYEQLDKCIGEALNFVIRAQQMNLTPMV